MKRNLFIYWIEDDFKLIYILRKLIELHSKSDKGYCYHFINNENILDYIYPYPDFLERIGPTQKSDYLRTYLLYTFGGIWLDSDTLVIESLDILFDYLETKSGFFILQNDSIICNGVFGSIPGTPLLKEWLSQQTAYINNKNTKLNWNEIGSEMLSHIICKNRKLLDNYEILKGLDTMYPVNWNNCKEQYLQMNYNNYKTIEKEFQPLLILVHTVYRAFEEMSLENIQKTPLFYFLEKSFLNVKDKTEFDNVLEFINEPNYEKYKNSFFDRVFVLDVIPNKNNINTNFHHNRTKLKLEEKVLKELNYEEVKIRSHLHWKAWKEIHNKGLRRCLIIENGTTIKQNFNKVLCHSLQDASKLGHWDIIYLTSIDESIERRKIENTKYLYEANNECTEIHAYIVDIQCVRNILLKNFEKPGDSLSGMINWASCDWILDSKGYMIEPFIVDYKPYLLYNVNSHLTVNYNYDEELFNQLVGHIYIINLESSTARRDHMIQQMERAKLTNYSFFKAINGKILTEEELDDILHPDKTKVDSKLYNSENHTYYRGSIACSKSHLECWKKIVASGLEHSIVFEDNIYLCNDFKNKLFNVLQRCSVASCNMIHLNINTNYVDYKRKLATQLPPDNTKYRSNIFIGDNEGGGTKAYYVKSSFLKEVLIPTFEKITTTADGMTKYGSCGWVKNTNSFAVLPLLIVCYFQEGILFNNMDIYETPGLDGERELIDKN